MRISSLGQLLLTLTTLALVACGSDDGNNVTTDFGGSGGDTGGSAGTPSGGSPTGGTDTGGSGGSGGSGPTSCADLSCTAPATCDDSGATPACVCPSGYVDTNNDGSQCDDIDECADGTDDCDANATCTNNDGGFDCACNEPAYTGDGTSCTCGTGYVDVSGSCLKDDIETCADGTECASGNCVGGVCCGVACDSPGVCETLTGTVCLNGDSCQYGLATDGTACDDGDACTQASCSNGECVVDTVTQCTDSDACTSDTCNPATGTCVFTAVDCDDGNPCTTDGCDTTNGCTYANDDGQSCDDGDPCTTDTCGGGVCNSTPLDCSSFADDCNDGVCNAGTCEAQPKNQGGACADGLTVCDATGLCNAGTCEGQADACGPLAASCTDQGCPGDPDCYQGRLCTCVANNPAHIIKNGVCEEDTNECNADPCDPIAACNDPTPDGAASNDYVCTCPTGYTGGGTGSAATSCVDIDECASGDPCGDPSIVASCDGANPAGSYSCTCATGFTSIPTPSGPTCVCDMGGTYEVVTNATFYFDAAVVSGVTVTEGSGTPGIETTSWALRHHTVESDGTLTVKTIPCGGTSPTVCSTLGQALAQYQGNDVWGKASYNNGFPEISVDLAGVVPGGAMNEPQTASLAGITLTNPEGEWPPCEDCVGLNVGSRCCLVSRLVATACTTDNDCSAPNTCSQTTLNGLRYCETPACTTDADCTALGVCDTNTGTCANNTPCTTDADCTAVCDTVTGNCAHHTVTNRAQWVNSDGNSALGVSTWAVRNGGEVFGPNFLNDPNPDPPYEYAADSVCPRMDQAAPRYPYGAWPGLITFPSFQAFYTMEWRGATRVISQYTGDTITLANGACEVSGEITGPDAGRAQTDARIGACKTATAPDAQSGDGSECTETQIRFYDDVDQIQEVVAASFAMRKSPSIDLDVIFALPTLQEQEDALNTVCEEVRVTYCPSGENCDDPNVP